MNNRLARLQISSPFTIPSGVVTTTPPVIARIARDIPEIGFLTTKTVSLDPRPGYREPIIHEYHPGCFVNAVGLANPGAKAFRELMEKHLPLHGDKPLFVSIMGMDAAEFIQCAEILAPIADAFELNLSCPHVKGAGQAVGSDPLMVAEIVRGLRARFDKPIVCKLSPNLPDPVSMARVCEDSGADALCLINTVGPGMAVDQEGNPILSNVLGGLSGAGVLPIGLKSVRDAASAVRIPIIAAGGIDSANTVRAYKAAGARLFSVGSALKGMDTRQLAVFFRRLVRELNDQPVGEPCRSVCVQKPMTSYQQARVEENSSLGAGVFRITLDSGPACDPGQFFFLRLPGVGEKPFSPASDEKPMYLVRNVGPFTAALEALNPGDSIYMRGPYGKGFPEPFSGKRLVLLAGGTGAAPVTLAANRWPDRVARAFFGFSQEISTEFREEILWSVPSARVVADPPGRVGEVIRSLIEDMAADPDFYSESQVFMCGPSAMMRIAVGVLLSTVKPDGIFVGREDIMRCGVGLCGSCGTETGLRSCVDGPVLSLAQNPLE